MGMMKSIEIDYNELDLSKKNYVWCQMVALFARAKIPQDKNFIGSLRQLAKNDLLVKMFVVKCFDIELSARFSENMFEFMPGAHAIRFYIPGLEDPAIVRLRRGTLSNLDAQAAIYEIKDLMTFGRLSKESAITRIAELAA